MERVDLKNFINMPLPFRVDENINRINALCRIDTTALIREQIVPPTQELERQPQAWKEDDYIGPGKITWYGQVRFVEDEGGKKMKQLNGFGCRYDPELQLLQKGMFIDGALRAGVEIKNAYYGYMLTIRVIYHNHKDKEDKKDISFHLLHNTDENMLVPIRFECYDLVKKNKYLYHGI